MLTKDNFPQSLKTDLKIAYQEGRDAFTGSEYREMIQVVPTTSSAKLEVFYGNKGKLQRFRGERQPKSFNEYKQTLTLDTWELTTTVKRDVLDDDQSGGMLRRKVTDFGNAVERSLKEETERFLRDGVSVMSFDGNPFFTRSHVYQDSTGATRGTAWSNLDVGLSLLDSTTLQLAEQHFAGLMGDDNEVLGMQLTHLVVKRGSLNHKAAKELSNSMYTVEANTFKDNIFKGSFGIIPVDYGFTLSDWAALDLSQSDMKPIKVLSHTVSAGFGNLEYTQLLEDSDTGFWRDEFAFGVYGRFDWNPGDPRTAYLHGTSNGTATAPADLERQRVLKANV
jgi:phage major head subunit gpT-like protein